MIARFVFALGLVSPFAFAQKCYSLDGQELDDTYQPCNPNAKVSACCALNGTDSNNDVCLDSGLCQSTSGWYAGFIWANGCTDPTGKDNSCPQACAGMVDQYSFNVLQCNPGTFCCRAGYDKTNCCNSNQTIIQTSHIGSLLLPGSDSVVNTTYYSPAATTSSTPNCTATTPSTANFTANSTCPADHTAVVGGTVGGILGAALIASLVVLFFVLSNRKALNSEIANIKVQRDSALQNSADEKAILLQQYQQQLHQQQQQQQHMAAPMYQASPQIYQPSPPFGGAYASASALPINPPSQASTLHSVPSELGPMARPVEMDTQNNPSELSDGVERIKELPRVPSAKSG